MRKLWSAHCKRRSNKSAPAQPAPAPSRGEILLAESNCQFAQGAGISASWGNVAITDQRILYFKHGVAKILLLGHAVHLTKGDFDMEIPFSEITRMYWNQQGFSRYLGLHLRNGEHHRINFIEFDKCMSAIQQVLPDYPIPKAKSKGSDSMNAKKWRFLLVILCAMLLGTLAACVPSPDNAQIEAAIRTSLSDEASPPALDFDSIEVPMRTSGKANAVLWTADNSIQRNYTLEYNSGLGRFWVTGFTTSVLGPDGTYSFLQPAPLSEYASYFGFSDDVGERVRIIYIGQRGSAVDARAQYEATKISHLTVEQLAEFEVCDLGGDALVLLVPKYEGTVLRITKVETMGDALIQGDEVDRFENGKPVYLWYDWNGAYDIGVTLGGSGGSIRGYEGALAHCKEYEDGYIY